MQDRFSDYASAPRETPLEFQETGKQQQNKGDQTRIMKSVQAAHASLGKVVNYTSRLVGVVSRTKLGKAAQTGYEKVAEIGLNGAKKNQRQQEKKWRSEDKYEGVLNGIKSGLSETYAQIAGSGSVDLEAFSTLINKLDQEAPGKAGAKGTAEETRDLIKAALDILYGKVDFSDQRERHTAYKEAVRRALNTEYYQNNPSDTPDAQLLNCLCAAEFTQVRVQEMTESFVEMKAPSVPREKLAENANPMDFFQQNVDIGRLDEIYHSVGNQETLGQKTKGEVMFLGLDPLMQGNPANVKADVTTSNDRHVVDVRTPTPTDGDGKVVPEFKAFLRFLKATDQKYAMVNLQNRVSVPAFGIKMMMDCNGEHVRSKNLEALQQEFPTTINVFTLDKNSRFFQQHPTKQDLASAIGRFPNKAAEWNEKLKDKGNWIDLADEICQYASDHNATSGLSGTLLIDKDKFIGSFMEELMSPDSGFHLPEEFHDPAQKEKISLILNTVASHVFPGKDSLTPKERQDCIEICYALLTAHFVNTTGADYFNQSCKDCIDRGGGANWLMLAMTTLKEIHEARGNMTEALTEKVRSLPFKLQEDSLWARKRGLIHERLERAGSAINRLAELSKNQPDHFEKLYDAYQFARSDFSVQTTGSTQ